MKNQISLIIIIFTFQLSFSQSIIPDWFEELPNPPGGIHYSAGYSGKYIDQSLARKAALTVAINNMTKQLKSHLIYELEEFADGRFRLLDPTFELSFDESILDMVREDYSALDSSITDEGYFILISYPKFPGRLSISFSDKIWGKRPDWVDKTPKSKKYNYGVGVVSNYSSWVRAWKDVDEYARFDLGKNQKIEARSIHAVKRNNKQIIESKIINQFYDEYIFNSSVVSRWYDKENDTYYSLCRQARTDYH